MSLDIYLMTPESCPHCGMPLPPSTEIFSQNYTHNVVSMWTKAGVYDALYMSDTWTVDKDYLQTLREGIANFERAFAEYEKLDPSNGWGSAAGALSWLRKWLEACEKNLGATIHVSK